MKLTNKKNLPVAFVNAIKIYRPVAGRYGVTSLLNDPLQRTLLDKYWETLEIDVEDLIETVYGNALDTYLSQFESDDAMVQPKLEQAFGEVTVVGKPDIYYPKTFVLEDYKFTKIAAIRFSNTYPHQLNIYRWLLEQQGHKVEIAQLHYCFKDFRKMMDFELKRNPDYPKAKIITHKVNLWSLEQTEGFIRNRLKLHLEKPEMECTKGDFGKWQGETTYAVMKKGRDSAIAATNPLTKEKLLSREDCETVIRQKNWTQDYAKKIIWIEERKGFPRKCKDFCLVRSVCPYAKDLK